MKHKLPIKNKKVQTNTETKQLPKNSMFLLLGKREHTEHGNNIKTSFQAKSKSPWKQNYSVHRQSKQCSAINQPAFNYNTFLEWHASHGIVITNTSLLKSAIEKIHKLSN